MFERKAAGEGIADVDKKNRVIIGYASTFGNKDRHNDVVVKGAFKRTLTNNPTKVKVFMHHDPVYLVGKPQNMREDNKGLYTESMISDTAAGRDLLTLIEDGVLTDLSIGFKTILDEWDEGSNTRYIKEAQLFEYSFVAIPANTEANVVGFKSIDQLNHILTSMNRAEKALRDGDFVTDEIPERLEIIVKTWREQLDNVFYEMKKSVEEATPESDLVTSSLDNEPLITDSDSDDSTRKDNDSVPSTDSPDSTQDEELDLVKALRSRAARIEMAAALKRIERKIKGV